MTPSSELKQRILAAARAEPAPDRRGLAVRALLILGAAAAVALVEFQVTGGIRIANRPLGFVALTTAAYLACALGVTFFALRRGRSMLGQPRVALIAAAVLAPVAPLAAVALGNLIWPSTAVVIPGHPGYVCFDLSLSLGAWPLVGLGFVRRGSDPVHPVASGAALGAIAGTWAGLLINLTCRYSDLAHAALGHALPALVQVGLGALVGQVVVALRARSEVELGMLLGGAAGAWLGVTWDLHLQYGCPDRIEPRELFFLGGGALLGAAVGGLAARIIFSSGESSAGPRRGGPEGGGP